MFFSAATLAGVQGTAPVNEILKQASRGFCGGWMARMEAAGLTVNVQNVSGEEIHAAKEASGFTDDLWACHTASVSGYTVESHVPVSHNTRLLSERPVGLGVAISGLKCGDPGKAFNVVLLSLDPSHQIMLSTLTTDSDFPQ